MSKSLLLLSSSRAGDSAYLETGKQPILSLLGDIEELVFIPYAGVSISYDEYTQMVQNALPEIKIVGIHEFDDPIAAVNQAQAIAVGGGNTFELLNQLYLNKLISPIQSAVENGMKYIGWSAGSNVAGKTIRTTNDMPIVEPASFNALALIDCQINPHYTDYQPPGHNGETRAQRLEEFMTLNPEEVVLATREGTGLLVSGDDIQLIGELPGIHFKAGKQTEIAANSAVSI